jgi:hypothetical protein
MHPNVTDAVASLQARLRTCRSIRAAEHTEEALDLLLNQPNNNAPPYRQIRNAISEAGKKLANRARLLTEARMRELTAFGSNGLEGFLEIELTDFVGRGVVAADGPLLAAAMRGGGAEEIACDLGIPIARARERLSRARGRAFPLWFR